MTTASPPVKFLISGAAGQIAYSLIPLVASGLVLGPKQSIDLVLLDIPQCIDKLAGVIMEIDDACFPCLNSVVAESDPNKAFNGVQYAILLGGFPRGKGMERKDLISKNTAIFKQQGEAINKHAHKNIKILVVANPANTNAFVLMTYAPSIPKKNIACLTRLDMNRCRSQIANRLSEKLNKKVCHCCVHNCIIWGNHSSTQVPDVNYAEYEGQPVRKLLNNDKYLDNDFITLIQQRGKAVIDARGLSSAFSAAQGAGNAMRDWILGSPEGECVCMGVYSEGNPFGIDENLIFSFPLITRNGEWTIVKDYKPIGHAAELVKLTMNELKEEKVEAMAVINGTA